MNKIIAVNLDFILNCGIDWKIFKNKNILITGAYGMLLSYMTYTLLRLNELDPKINATVIALIRDKEKAKKRFGHFIVSKHLKLFEHDLLSSIKILDDVDFIIHGASYASPHYFGTKPVAVLLPNVVGTYHLLELAKSKNIKSFLFFSSGAVYGEAGRDVVENKYGYLVDNGLCPAVDSANFPNDLNIRLIRYETNQRPNTDICNKALRDIDGTNFVFLSDNDIWTPHTLEIVTRISSSNSEIKSLGVGFSRYDLSKNRPLHNQMYFKSFSSALERYDAFKVGIGDCSFWGIGKITNAQKTRMSHSSASFLDIKLIQTTIENQGELFVRPFENVGLVGCCFYQDYLYYLDLPLVILGESHAKEMNGALPGHRMRWQQEVPFIEFSPVKAGSFINMSVESHFNVLYRNGVNKKWDCTLRSDFFIKHLKHIATDDPWMDETWRDIEDALPFAVESLMKYYHGQDNEFREALKQQIITYLRQYALQVKEIHKESSRTEKYKPSEFNNFKVIVDFANYVDKNFVQPKFKTIKTYKENYNFTSEKQTYIPISFVVVGVYNEEHRIKYVLEHAMRWADEVIVVNKSSTDRTKEICLEYGEKLKVIDIPFSPRGHEDTIDISKLTSYYWIFFGPASEIPTRKLIKRCREILNETNGELDLVYVPRKYYSFGINDRRLPWSISYFPFLINRKKAIITNVIHHNFRPSNPNNTRIIEFSDECCVYHLTHVSAKAYMRDMTDYFEAEAASCTDPKAKIKECFAYIARFQQQLLEGGDELLGHYLAWPIYWLGTALFVWEKK